MTDLSTKPCPCGKTLGQVIGYNERYTDKVMVPYRVGWYCPNCKNIEKAIGREGYVDDYTLLSAKENKSTQSV